MWGKQGLWPSACLVCSHTLNHWTDGQQSHVSGRRHYKLHTPQFPSNFGPVWYTSVPWSRLREVIYVIIFSLCFTTIFVLLKYTSLEFSVCVLDWELSLTLLWIPSNSHSLLQMRHQKGSVNERRNKLQREEKVWTSIRKGRWFAAGCAGDSWKDTASKFRRQCLKLSIPETKTTCFLLEKD